MGARALPLIACLALGAPESGFAQNLFPAGELDVPTDADEWTDSAPAGTIAWDSLDHDDCASDSGSALVSNSGIVNFAAGYQTCIGGIVAGETYSFGAYFRLNPGQVAEGYLWLSLTWFTNSTCGQSTLGTLYASPDIHSTDAGVWKLSSNDSVTAPGGALSATLGVALTKTTTGTLIGRFDGVYIAAEPGLLFADSFAIGSDCRWSETAP